MSQPSQADLFHPAFKANPYPTYAQLRSDTPIHRVTLPDGHDMWLVTRYENVSAVLKDENPKLSFDQLGHPLARPHLSPESMRNGPLLQQPG